MITLYGKGYPEEERKGYTDIIYNNVITAMKTLCEMSDAFAEKGHDTKIREGAEEAKKAIEELKIDAEINSTVGEYVRILWADEGIQATFEERAHFQFPDSGQFFFERIDDIEKDDYIPSEQDVLRSRVRTTGIVETNFEIEGNHFKMFDVGGQRNERKKWIHCFENVTCVLFVAAISEYDQVLYEDETTNRMIEALNLFDEICNSRWFLETSIVLFLNKRDLFEEKIRKVPLTTCWPDYDGVQDYESGCEFIREQFEMRNKQDKEIYTHITCATDTGNVAHVFNAVKDILIKQSLRAGGLL
ncbi:MAG: hypothetical protein MHM6MM_004875 [Cercozoa sp. M6MM]